MTRGRRSAGDEGGAPRRIHDALDRVLADLGAAGVGATVDLVEHWPEIVGPALADATHPLGVRDHHLLVAVTDPVVAERLVWEEAAIVDRLDALLGAGVITELRVRVRPPGE